ncbi:peptide-methionine (R)-S-oxide reductase MsrB [Acidicapsa ligni]|uniref:peptide-methionine (R)-S-oxide reductase MsrB n=1 Tax=Acidicapsa ligni TaxID=542300 RepID=UPI0021E08CC7|nr:peptide-methionine (R)-S-oxide reductase MsrB [Acidicapsa ligni]
MNRNFPEQPATLETNGQTSIRRTSRRNFLFSTASTCSLFALSACLTSPVKAIAKGDSSVTIIQFSPDGKKIGKVSVPRVVKTDAEWEKQLSPVSYEVTRHAATERAYTGNTWNLHDHGIYRCVCCDLALFSSETKFESGTGWPSFWQPLAKENVREMTDNSLGISRTEIACTQCDAHLGHLFDDGPKPTGMRYCMNSASMRFTKTA